MRFRWLLVSLAFVRLLMIVKTTTIRWRRNYRGVIMWHHYYASLCRLSLCLSLCLSVHMMSRQWIAIKQQHIGPTWIDTAALESSFTQKNLKKTASGYFYSVSYWPATKNEHAPIKTRLVDCLFDSSPTAVWASDCMTTLLMKYRAKAKNWRWASNDTIYI